MGYSHYYEVKDEVPDEYWASFVDDVKKLLADPDTRLIKKYAEPEQLPVVNDFKVMFNGHGPDGCEDFVLGRGPQHDGVKTNNKAYDKYVAAVLVLARIHFGSRYFEFTSDGSVYNYELALMLLHKKTGWVAHFNVFNTPEGQALQVTPELQLVFQRIVQPAKPSPAEEADTLIRKAVAAVLNAKTSFHESYVAAEEDIYA